MRQLFQPIARLPDRRSGRILGAFNLTFLPLTALGGVPELASQLVRAGEKAAPKDFLRRGLNLFLGAV